MPRILIPEDNPFPMEELHRAMSAVQLGRKIGISANAIYMWKRVPAERVAQISELTGIPRWRMRPDLWERPRRKVRA